MRLERITTVINTFLGIYFLSVPVYVGAQSSLLLQDAFPKLSTFTKPIEITHANDFSNRLFVVEQAGIIKVFPNDSNVTSSQVVTFLDIRTRITSGGEMGLLGMAFDPNYRYNGYLYVNYTRTDKGQLQTVISRFHVNPNDPNLADVTSEKLLLVFNQPYSNHNGGKLAFGKDGYLYIATGDGGSGGDPQNNGQNLSTVLGKILRIDVNQIPGIDTYSIPSDNPFVTRAGARPEIYAYGLRNPWKFSFDPVTGYLWAGDVGQNAREEINLITKGGNYGWRYREGKACYNPSANCPTQSLIDPIWDYIQSSGTGRSVTGGLVYRGSLLPALYGKYIYGDFVSGNMWTLTYDTTSKRATNEFLMKMNGNISAFGEDQHHELYICSYSSGRIQKLKDALVLANEPELATHIDVYPNPSTSLVHIKLKLAQSDRISLRLYSMQGKLVYSLLSNEKVTAGETELTLDTKSLSAGTYIYQLESKKINQSGRIQIIK
ncbi:PQQ-dependent sugar dehydrogenase [Xanthocytophaga agilis]|uniref:PQQ-dependent sugar dehydrogenase n=1 Tax=Xanthocytophaga agilis TaxID=3048010 RepID=A0AAE3UJX8_9BACT|nr:PQQ-dependent sugar dehydrogenase [Xanthocytophaga agilis]MDJ1506732.1 PQQ-dependent sugar dehydrogenase [Xanthocytophaga agilis]